MRLDECSGSCAERIRGSTWQDTALGPIEDWPAALRMVLGMMLRSAAPKLLVWGEDLTTFYNDSLMRLLATGPEGIGSALPPLLPRAWPHVEGLVRAAMEGGGCGQCDLALNEGAARGPSYYHICFTPVPGDERAAGVLIDVYDATHSHQRELALRSENTWLAKLFAESPVFMAYGYGADFQIEFANAAFRKFFGDRELVGEPLKESIPEAFDQGFGEILNRVFETGQPFIGSDMKVVIGPPNGAPPRVAYADFVYQPVRSDDDSEVIGILCTGSEVTARHNAQIEAERLKHQVLHASRINAMGTMAMTVAHELNQPLAAAANYLAAAQLMIGQPSGAPLATLKAAEDEVLRAGDVIRRIRSLVRSGHSERSSVSIEKAYQRAVMLLGTGDVNGSTFALDLGRNATNVMADEIQLEQILTNLFRNAVTAMQTSEHKQVKLITESGVAGKILLTVRDTGPGLPSDMLQTLFDQVGISSGTGLGLGLPLTRTLIEANGGTIEASNAPEGGAIFKLEMDCG